MEQRLNLKRMQEEWKAIGMTTDEVAELIDIDPRSLTRKLRGERSQELSATQAHVLCEAIGRPLDMFIMRK